MIIQENFRLQFYELLRKGHTLIVAGADVDSLCATTILTYIFSCDDVPYTLNPVDSFASLENAINTHKGQAQNIILVNCLGSNSFLDLDIADLPTDVKIWVLESRRPLNLNDIYNADAVRMLVPAAEIADWELPEASAIYSQEDGHESEEGRVETESDGGSAEEDDDDGGEEEGEEDTENADPERTENVTRMSPRPKKRRKEKLTSLIERRTYRRQQKIKWRRTRRDLMWNYYMKSWHAAPVSLLVLELSHELGKCSAEMMWCAAVALNSLFFDQLISVETYSELCMDRLRPFIRKYGPKVGIPLDRTRGDDQLRINYDRELVLPLYPHWTLYESMTNDPFFMCQSKLWSQHGEDRFREILSQLGLTLAECSQNYEVIKKERRREVFDILEKHMNVGFYSFTSHLGYSTCYSASDFARAMSLRLEYKAPKQNDAVEDEELICCERFNRASRILRDFFKLGGREFTPLVRAIGNYKLALQSLNDLIKRSIVQSHVISASRYFIITIGPQCPSLGYFSSRHCLFLFTHSLLRAFASSKATRRSKPFLVCVPMVGSDLGWFLITGMMSLTEQMADPTRKSIIGQAFERAAEMAHIELRRTFDSSVVSLKSEDRLRFFNHLEARLEIV